MNTNKKTIYIIIALLFSAVLLSGCVEQKETSITEDTDKEILSKINSLIEENKDLKDRINKIENEPEIVRDTKYDAKIERLEKVTSIYGLIVSDNTLIPDHVPFKVELIGAKEQGSWTYVFKENGFVDINGIGRSDSDAATYKIDRNNNTIMINSDKYNYYGIRLIDGYGYTISKTGSIVFSYKSTIIPPVFNTVTQKYELN